MSNKKTNNCITNSKRKIAMFIPSLNRGGAERVFLNLARSFTSLNCDVDLLLSQGGGSYLSDLPNNVQIIQFDADHQYKTLVKLVKYFKVNSPCALFTALPLSGFFSLIALRITHKSPVFICTVHTLCNQKISTKDYFIQKLDILAYKYCNFIVAVSAGVAQQVINDFRIPEHKVKIIHNPVISDNNLNMQLENVDHPFFSIAKPVIISAGRLEEQKGFSLLIDAINEVSKCEDIRLIILGEGIMRKKLEEQIINLGLSDIISLPGHVQNPYAYMKRCDIFVLPSYKESFGNVLIEALACGCSVISTDCPCGPAEVLSDGKYGKLIKMGDSHEMAKSIIELLHSKKREIPKEYLDNFYSDTIAKKYLSLLFEKMKGKNE